MNRPAAPARPSQQVAPVPSRRGVLKAAAAGAVALSAAPLVHGDPAPAPSPAAPANKLRIAVVGCGGQGRGDMKAFLGNGETVVALCDVDARQIEAARQDVAKAGQSGATTQQANDSAAAIKSYSNFHKLLEDAATFDAVLVATPDHWHAPIAKACMKAGKHVYCEKPLTHFVAEARELREVADATKVVTQMGNQGSAGASFRRSVELIRAGALGQIREMHSWLSEGGFPHDRFRPADADPTPKGLDWDAWCGPSNLVPYKNGIYHLFAWRGWKDFASGQLGDFGCHSFNLAQRALELSYPQRLEIDGPGWVKDAYSMNNRVRYYFPQRGRLDPLTIHWYDGGAFPDDSIVADVKAVYPKLPLGTLLVGEKGVIFTNPWNNDCLIKLTGEAKLKDVMHHEATKDVPQSVPRTKGHHAEFAAACKGEGKTYSPFQIGGLLTEIVLSGVVALRLGKGFEWDGEAMKVKGMPDADRIIRPDYRRNWAAGGQFATTL